MGRWRNTVRFQLGNGYVQRYVRRGENCCEGGHVQKKETPRFAENKITKETPKFAENRIGLKIK